MKLRDAMRLLESIRTMSERYNKIFKDTKIEYGDSFGYNMKRNTIYIRKECPEDTLQEHREKFLLDYVNQRYGARFYTEDHDDFSFLHECGHAYDYLTTKNKDNYIKKHFANEKEMNIMKQNLESVIGTQMKIIKDIYEEMIDIYDNKLCKCNLFKEYYTEKLDELIVKVNEHFSICYNAVDTVDIRYRELDDESFADKWACENYNYAMFLAYEWED